MVAEDSMTVLDLIIHDGFAKSKSVQVIAFTVLIGICRRKFIGIREAQDIFHPRKSRFPAFGGFFAVCCQ